MRTAIAIISIILGLAGNLAAADLPTNNITWRLLLKREGVPTIKPIFRAYLISAVQEFAFFVPQDLSVVNDAGKIKFLAHDGNCVMTLRIIGPVPDTGELDAAHARQRLLAEHPDAVVTSEFSRRVADHYANGFDMEWTATNNITQCRRTVYAHSALGFLEFTAVTGRADFPAIQATLDTVLATFRASRNGTLEEIHISPNS